MTFSLTILDFYLKRPNPNRPFIVALDGLSGAGKTTFVQACQQEWSSDIPVVIIHIDDHITERTTRYHTGHDEWYEYYQLQWDVPLLAARLFQPLLESRSEIELPFYQFDTDTVEMKTVAIPQNSLVLVEGIFLQREEWQVFYDHIIYLDCPRDVRYERALQRDTYIGDMSARVAKYKNRYWPAEAFYLDTIKPRERADAVYQA